MVLSTHKQASTLLIHQQSFIAAGPRQPEGPETMLGLELCRVGATLRICYWKLPPGLACGLSQAKVVHVTRPTHV